MPELLRRIPAMTNRIALRPAVALAAAILGACGPAPTEDPSGPYAGSRLTGAAPQIVLIDHGGEPLALASLRGDVVVLTFMDSTCQDVCPLTAAELRLVHRELTTAERQGTSFIGVNANALASSVPDVLRATRQWRLDEIESWHFVTGEPDALRAVWEAYGIEAAPDGVRVRHTSGVFLIDRRGSLRWYVSVPLEDPEWDGPALSEILLRRIRELLMET
jgi:protein SCO1/2